MKLKCNSCLAKQCVDCRFKDSSENYWNKVILKILNKRDLYEAYIKEKYFISLSDDEQKYCMEIADRELHDLASAMGFKKGSKVRNILTNEIFIVSGFHNHGRFGVNDIVFDLYKGDRKTIKKVKNSINPYLSGCIMHVYSSKKVLYGLDELRQRFCFYKPV